MAKKKGRPKKGSRKTRTQLRQVKRKKQQPRLKRDLDRMTFFAVAGWGLAAGAVLYCVFGM